MLFIDQPEPGCFVDPSGRDEDVVCPELDLLVFAKRSELDAFVDQSSADSQATC